MSTTSRGGRRRERGTSALEVAGMAPLVVLVIFILIQAAVALYAITTAQTAVRQSARAYALDGASSADSVLQRSVPGWLEIRPGDKYIGGPDHTVRVTFDIPDVVPLYDLRITRETVMP